MNEVWGLEGEVGREGREGGRVRTGSGGRHDSYRVGVRNGWVGQLTACMCLWKGGSGG